MKLLSSAEFWLYLLLANLIDICTKYIQNIYFPTLASVLRERCVLSAKSAQVACDPLDKQKSGSLSVPLYGLSLLRRMGSTRTTAVHESSRRSRSYNFTHYGLPSINRYSSDL
ncbi:hypothetical protein PF001_g15486 [Phytophthora fragariae]|uniref:Uncharacterized protein n=1 Tax=Phytophthora fragariae TaxID=53985 RepID=A0A6A4D0A1_9STRA|nr:hypothetical protein PF006_g15187 [Phytophthora fragariae]KAE9299345.1 hypothetical protein PF001_g15486 [Phytophthora fragariae]KAE9301247.1 hypothetical protein PF008_g22810 [Phytophthora fragariae]